MFQSFSVFGGQLFFDDILGEWACAEREKTVELD
jgi:hypothetical protein